MTIMPTRIGSCEFGMFGTWVAIRCPQEFDHLMRRAGGLLFRQAGINLDDS
jgi:hypothetical protein